MYQKFLAVIPIIAAPIEISDGVDAVVLWGIVGTFARIDGVIQSSFSRPVPLPLEDAELTLIAQLYLGEDHQRLPWRHGLRKLTRACGAQGQSDVSAGCRVMNWLDRPGFGAVAGGSLCNAGLADGANSTTMSKGQWSAGRRQSYGKDMERGPGYEI